MDNRQALIALNMIKGLGSIRVKELLAYFSEPHEVFEADGSELEKIKGIGKNIIKQIITFDSRYLSREIALACENRIEIITILDNGYPKLLKEIHDPPIVLYIKGKLEHSDLITLAIVGTRRASFYGLELAEKFAYQLALCGIIIVSGLARGIDSSAHRGALKANGKTWAVLGSGLLSIYPPENKKLAEEISQKGALISEYPLETPPLAENFPRRNRIISGLSRGVVVIEAPLRSGALITANLAMEQGREVFAVPGRINSRTSIGTNRLIKDGAKLVEDVDDILEEFDLFISNKCDSYLNLNLNKREQEIFNILQEAMTLDEILNISDISLAELQQILLSLQLKGLIKEMPGKIYQRK